MAEDISVSSSDHFPKSCRPNTNPRGHRPVFSTTLARKPLGVFPELDGSPPEDAAVDQWQEQDVEERPPTPLPPRFEDMDAAPEDSLPTAKRRRITMGGYALDHAPCSEQSARYSLPSWPGERRESTLADHGPGEASIMQARRCFGPSYGADYGSSLSTPFASSHFGNASQSAVQSTNPSLLQPLQPFESAVTMTFLDDEDAFGNAEEYDQLLSDAEEGI